MPDGEKLPRCPKGEQRDKKTRKCVKKKAPSPKCNVKNTTSKRASSEKMNNSSISNIEELKSLQEVLEKKDAQKCLIILYSLSQTECTRHGVCGMEVGMSREKDQGAVLKYFLGDKINLDLDNTLPEDYRIGKVKISAKHSGGKVGTSVKAKWTSADISVKDAIEAMINADDSYYPNLLLTYLDTKNKKITIICITSEHNKHVIKTMGQGAFTVPKGNSRGIEYSRQAMTKLLANRYFTIDIKDVYLKGGLNPIERRLDLLKTLLEPTP